MSLGGAVLKQHVVEFIVGTGIVTDGVVNSTSTNGPWTWTVPKTVARLKVDMVGSGSGGGGGGNATGNISCGGGGGGRGGGFLIGEFAVYPNSTLTVTVASAGTGAAIGGFSSGTGATTIEGIVGAWCDGVSGRIRTFNFSGNAGASPGLTSPTTFGAGGGGGASLEGGTSTGGTTSGATGTGGNPSSSDTTHAFTVMTGGNHYWGHWLGNGGSAGNSSGSVAGGGNAFAANNTGTNLGKSHTGITGGIGSTTGTVSLGAGGMGGSSFYGIGGKGGDGGVAGGNATGYGAGGGGGGGNAAGGNGTNGYVRLSYWSIN